MARKQDPKRTERAGKLRRDGDGIPLTCECYVLTFSDGNRGRLFKVGQRWHAMLPKGVKIEPQVARIKGRRKV